MIARRLLHFLSLPLLAIASDACAQVAPAAPRRNLVVIVVDTLRADRLSCYGYAKPTTPRFDALAKRGLRFERAYGTAPWTLPSTASLLSGLQPEMHRGTHFFASLSPDCRLLAERLEGDGYATAAFVGNYFVQPLFGFERGFAQYDEGCMVDRGGVNSDKISDAAIAWLDQHAKGDGAKGDGAQPPKPFLLYLHYFDPHYNYWEHDGFTFGGEDTERVFSGADIYALRDQQKRFDVRDRERLSSLYDSEVAFTDHHVGRVLDHLAALGRDGDTCVLLTADHGEALGEHGWIGHTIQLYEESVRIPLIVAGPGIASAVAGPDPVQLDDVVEALLRITAGEPAGEWNGAAARIDAGLKRDEALCCVDTVGIEQSGDVPPPKSVTRFPWKLFIDPAPGGGDDYRLFKQDEPKGKRKKRIEEHPAEMRMLLEARAEEWAAQKKERERTQATLTRRRALVQGTWKVIVDLVDDSVELYDLAADPGEKSDLADAQPERAAAMKARLTAVCDALAANALRDGPPLDAAAAEEHRKKIEATGYGNR
jgi:arylsulfatase A-like enzyme